MAYTGLFDLEPGSTAASFCALSIVREICSGQMYGCVNRRLCIPRGLEVGVPPMTCYGFLSSSPDAVSSERVSCWLV